MATTAEFDVPRMIAAIAASIVPLNTPMKGWLIDSGSSKPVCSEPRHMTKIIPYEDDEKPYQWRNSDGKIAMAEARGRARSWSGF